MSNEVTGVAIKGLDLSYHIGEPYYLLHISIMVTEFSALQSEAGKAQIDTRNVEAGLRPARKRVDMFVLLVRLGRLFVAGVTFISRFSFLPFPVQGACLVKTDLGRDQYNPNRTLNPIPYYTIVVSILFERGLLWRV